MKKNIYISSGAFGNNNDLNQIFFLLKKNKINSVEFSGGIYEQNLIKTLKKNKNYNFIFHNYFPVPRKNFVLNLASNNKKIISQSFSHIKNAIRICKIFNLKYYSLHSGFLYDPDPKLLGKEMKLCKTFDRKSALSRFIKNVNFIGDYAKKYDIKILLENNIIEKKEYNLFKKNTVLMSTIRETIFIMKNTRENIKLLIDVGHLNVAARTLKFNRIDFLKKTLNWTEGYQLSENDGIKDCNSPVKERSWFWPYINRRLDYYSLEVYNLDIDVIKKNLQLIKKKLFK
mgnify:CR=1 FL=1